MKFKFKFNTLAGPQEVTMTDKEVLANPAIADFGKHLIDIFKQGANGGVFNVEYFGRVQVTMIEQKDIRQEFEDFVAAQEGSV